MTPVEGRAARAVVVRDAATAAAVLRLAPAQGVVLLSPPDAAVAMGPAWFLAIAVAADAAVPGVAHHVVLDCGAAPGQALAALRLGARVIVLSAEVAAFGAIRSAAAEIGAAVWATRPDAYDPGRDRLRRAPARERLAAWLAAP